ncbi:MAG TPA: hypothetical protein VER17_18660 [Tepidisphaeraceae bacterium]|nr:hypothetical protein [Tepidisphaeraceae bacterium]
MGDLRNAKLIYAKGLMFLLIGFLCAALLLLDRPTLRTAALTAGAAWGFARFYYFAFYVIERYVDPGYRFAGLWSFARYALARPARKARATSARPR